MSPTKNIHLMMVHPFLHLLCFTNFFEVAADRMVSANICRGRDVTPTGSLAVVNAYSEISCLRACRDVSSCRSAKFYRDSDQKQCELFAGSKAGVECATLTANPQATVIMGIEQRDAPEDIVLVNPCQFNNSFNGTACVCREGFSGQFCEKPPRDCSDYPQNTLQTGEIYLPDDDEKITIYCYHGQMVTFAIPRNGQYTTHANSGWDDYKRGFGSLSQPFYDGEYWLGNDIMHRITGSLQYIYKFKMLLVSQNPTAVYECMYMDFEIDAESQNYTLHYSTYDMKNAAMVNILHDGIQFRAEDYNANICFSALFKSTSFWFNDTCVAPSPLLGTYPIDGIGAVTLEYFMGELIRQL